MAKKISVLVPAYNTEKYLRECLDSLVAQTIFSELEIICINDGSTDGSLKILREYKRKHPENFVIINKENTGYGDSMNRGLKRASGKYIGILESDDFVGSEAFEELFSLAERSRAEVARGNYYRYEGGRDEKVRLVDPSETGRSADRAGAGRLVNPQKSHHSLRQPPAIWTAIYRRDFLEKYGIDFLPTPGASYQDTSFAFKVWATARRAVFTEKAFLHYRIDNEASSSNSAAKAFCVCDEYAEIERFLKATGRFERLRGAMYACKLGAYLWNLDRLCRGSAVSVRGDSSVRKTSRNSAANGGSALRFLERFRTEFKAADLRRTDFSRREWIHLRLILRLPPKVYLAIHSRLH